MNETDRSKAVLTLRLIVAAMMAGIIAFAAVGLVIAGRRTPPSAPDTTNTLLAVLGVLILSEIPVYALIRRGIAQSTRRQMDQPGVPPADAEPVVRSYMTATILGAAMAEGPSLLGLIIYLVTGSSLALLAPAAGLLLLTLLLPSQGRLEKWVAQVSGPAAR